LRGAIAKVVESNQQKKIRKAEKNIKLNMRGTVGALTLGCTFFITRSPIWQGEEANTCGRRYRTEEKTLILISFLIMMVAFFLTHIMVQHNLHSGRGFYFIGGGGGEGEGGRTPTLNEFMSHLCRHACHLKFWQTIIMFKNKKPEMRGSVFHGRGSVFLPKAVLAVTPAALGGPRLADTAVEDKNSGSSDSGASSS
jgi:hypothetical protein